MRDTILQLEPARAKSIRADKLEMLWDDPAYVAEEKMNGWRFLMHVGGNLPRCHLTGRRTSSRTGVYSEKGLQVPCLWPEVHYLDYTVLDGEIMPPDGASFHDLASIMNSDPETAAEAIGRLGQPSYHVFDVLFNNGTDVREHALLERRQILEDLFSYHHVQNSRIHPLPCRKPTLEMYENIVDAGGEGVILKRFDAQYGESGAWIKAKKFSTLDVIVTGFTEAKHGVTGKFVGQIGAAIVSVWLPVRGTGLSELVEVGQVSGMTDDVRLDMTQNQLKWVGSVIEVAAQEFGRERLLHPRYRRHRPDADPRDATYEKMMRDLGAQPESRVVSGDQMELFQK